MKQPVIVVWDRTGKFFQIWTSTYNGDGIEHGKKIAERLGGSYEIFQETVDNPDKSIHNK